MNNEKSKQRCSKIMMAMAAVCLGMGVVMLLGALITGWWAAHVPGFFTLEQGMAIIAETWMSRAYWYVLGGGIASGMLTLGVAVYGKLRYKVPIASAIVLVAVSAVLLCLPEVILLAMMIPALPHGG